MLNWIDAQLNKVALYKFLTYILAFLLGIALIFSVFHILPYNPLALLFSILFITTICFFTNEICRYVYDASSKMESVTITAFILALIISPPTFPLDGNYFALAIWASVWAMASKYLFAIRKKHLFNPAAFAVALTALTIHQSASWWIGTGVMMPFVLISGLLIIKRMRYVDLMGGFFITALIMILGAGAWKGTDLLALFSRTFIEVPILFFAFFMLSEPITAPPTKKLRIIYGAIVGFFFAPWIHIGSLYMTPELALIAGNIFSYIVSPKHRFIELLKQKVCTSNLSATYSNPNNP